MNVSTIKDIITALVSAEKEGYTLKPEQYNEYLQKANIGLFNQALQDWEEEQVLTDILYPFKVSVDLIFVAGAADRPVDYARFSAAHYTIGEYNDWFLPSKDELNAMYTNLHLEGVGGFNDSAYHSSSEQSAGWFWVQHFGTGVQDTFGKGSNNNSRACRSFIAGAGDYSLRDTGPAGGLIFYIDGGTTYYEAVLTNNVIISWSNIVAVEIGASAQGTVIGTGQGNTTAIIGQAGHTDSSAKLCDDLVLAEGAGVTTVPIEVVTDNELPDRINNAITAPTENYPIICFYNEKINILPASITGGVDLLYVKNPATPIYKEKVEHGINVYDSVNSVQLDFDELYHPDIIRIIIGYIGIDIKDVAILQAIDKEKQENLK